MSLLHSSGVDPRELDGVPAQLLEPALAAFFATGEREVVILPFFFGPSAALTEYVPLRLRALQARFAEARIHAGRWLVDERVPEDTRVARILADQARAVRVAHGLARPHVVLVDHGSPQPAVTAVRNALGRQVERELAGELAAWSVASMERRPEAAYAFNEPLLATVLRREPFASGDVVVLQQFLSPGRHAGPEGDIAQICRAAEAECPALRTYQTEPIAGDARLIAVLADRYREALEG